MEGMPCLVAPCLLPLVAWEELHLSTLDGQFDPSVGQFWSLEGDEAFLALQTLHWNGRWYLLFPHDRNKE